MTRNRTASMARALAAVLLPLLAGAFGPLPARAQIDIGAAEREAAMSRIDLDEIPIRRHLLSGQALAVWLPEGWQEVTGAQGERAVFRSADLARVIILTRHAAPPGAALLPIGEQLVETLESTEGVDVESIRRVRVARRDALEITVSGPGPGSGEDEPMASRMLVTFDPDHGHYRTVLVRGPDAPDDPIDAVWKRLLRDWTPLDDGVWTSAFERLRSSAGGETDGHTWDQRNRLLDALARPEAIGQPWFHERLRALGERDPALLLDCALHPHPRVRIGCIEALDPGELEEPVRTGFFAAVTEEGDPAVRFRAARRIAGHEGAVTVLARLLESDSETARSGAFQLLAAAPAETRAAWLATAFADRQYYPEATQPFLAALVAEWGAPDEAAAMLRAAWKRTRVESLERAARLELVRLGDAEAIAATPSEPDESAEPGETAESGEGGETTPEDADGPDPSDVAKAWERLSVPMRASVPRPGDALFALLDLAARLEVGSPLHNQAFHSILDRLDRRVEDWAGDPITSKALGIDLEAPWELRWPGAAEDADDAESPPASARVALHVSASDPERLLDTLVRTGSGRLDLEGVSQGVLFTGALPLLPVGVLGAWNEEHERLTGADDSGSTPEPAESYLALGAATPAGQHEHRILYTLRIGDEGSEWSRTHLFRRGAEVVLTAVDEPLATGWSSDTAAAEEPASWSRVEVDLEPLLRDTELSDEDRARISRGDLTFSTATSLEPDMLATTFRLDGLSEEWLALAGSAAADDLRAPEELLPESSVAWMGLSLSPPDLATWLREDPFGLLDDQPRRRKRRVLRLVDHLGGEAGMALVGVPDPASENAAEAWGHHFVAYAAIEPAAADRLLKRVGERRETHAGVRFHRWDDLYLARVGGFVVAGTDPEVLVTLGRPPYLAAAPMFRRIAERAPADALLWMGWNTDLVADRIGEIVRGRDDEAASTFTLEIFRSFGDIAGWLGPSDSGLVGELASRPRLQSEATQARVGRLTGYGDLVRGSVQADGLPQQLLDGVVEAQVEMTLRLPDELPDAELDWTNERLDQKLVEPGLYRFVSRPATALPEESDLTLPFDAPELVPYTRNEHDLELHSDEIRKLAEEIRGDETDPARIVRAIVDWAHEGLEYTVIRESVSTEQILATRQADCTEFSQLTIALARSLGIPARAVHGAYVGTGAAYFHRWAEVYLDRWYEVDPTWGVVRIPATNLRIPLDDGLFLSALPGARFTIEEVEGEDGGWSRRLPDAPTARSGAADLAVDGERIVIGASTAAEDAPVGEPSVLYSEDGGASFAERSAPGEGGEFLQLLGGHGRLLRFAGALEGVGALVAHELDASGSWRRLRLPAALRESEAWTIGRSPSGYLALAGTSGRLLVLDRDLAVQTTAPLPGGRAGEWALAREGSVLAHSAEGEGITLHAWEGDGWADPVAVPESAELAVVAVHRPGEPVQIVTRHRTNGQLVRLEIADGTTTRRSLSPQEVQTLASTTRAADAEWSLWTDGRDRVLTKRPL